MTKITPNQITQSTATVLGRVSVGGGVTEQLTSAQMKTFLSITNVDNTSDANKPVSTATQTALNLKANLSGATFSGAISATNLSGTNTGDQTITLTGDVTGSGTGSFAATLATVNSNVGSFGSASAVPIVTVNAKGLITAVSTAALGTAAAQNTGTSGATIPFLNGINTWSGANTFSAKVNTVASATGEAGFGLPHGAAPTTPVNGDLWSTTTTVNFRLNGVTKSIAFLDSNITGSAATLTTGRTISTTGDVTYTSGSFNGSANVTGTATIATNAVTLAKMAQVATATFLGRTTAATGNVEALTATQATALLDLAVAAGAKGLLSGADKTKLDGIASGATANSGTVTSVSVTTANGVSGVVATSTTTPAITLTLGAITPTSVAATGTVTGTNLSGTNTGDQTITLTGNVTGSGTGSFATTIANNVVSNAMLAQVATATFKGRTTAATGNVEDLTVTQATAMLNTFSSTLKGLAPASGGGTTNFLRADGTWAAPVGGSGTVTSVSVTTANGVSGSVATATTTPAITLTLGAITPSSVATGTLSTTGVGSLFALRTTGQAEGVRIQDSSPYLSFFNSAATTRFGYIQHTGTNLHLENDIAGAINLSVQGTTRASVTGTGLAVTGTVNTTNNVFATVAANGSLGLVASDGTREVRLTPSNGGTGFAGVGTFNNNNFTLIHNASTIATVTSTGLAVTGEITHSGSISSLTNDGASIYYNIVNAAAGYNISIAGTTRLNVAATGLTVSGSVTTSRLTLTKDAYGTSSYGDNIHYGDAPTWASWGDNVLSTWSYNGNFFWGQSINGAERMRLTAAELRVTPMVSGVGGFTSEGGYELTGTSSTGFNFAVDKGLALSSSTLWVNAVTNNGYLGWAGSARLVWNNTGVAIGVATAAPTTYPLEVNGSAASVAIRSTDTGQPALRFFQSSTTERGKIAATATQMLFEVNGSTKMTLEAASLVYTGIISGSGYGHFGYGDTTATLYLGQAAAGRNSQIVFRYDVSERALLCNTSGVLLWGGNTVYHSGNLTPGTGTVSSVSVTTANGVSGTVATATTTPAITLTLGAITPTSVTTAGSVLAQGAFVINGSGSVDSGSVVLTKSGTGAFLNTPTGTSGILAVGNATAATWSSSGLQFPTTAGAGISFYGSTVYSIYMSEATNGTWGGRVSGETTSDYNIYLRIDGGGTNRGFVFKTNSGNVTGIDQSGNIRTAGSVTASSFIGSFSPSTITVSGTSTFNGNTYLGDSIADFVTVSAYFKCSSSGYYFNNAADTLNLMIISDAGLVTLRNDLRMNRTNALKLANDVDGSSYQISVANTTITTQGAGEVRQLVTYTDTSTNLTSGDFSFYTGAVRRLQANASGLTITGTITGTGNVVTNGLRISSDGGIAWSSDAGIARSAGGVWVNTPSGTNGYLGHAGSGRLYWNNTDVVSIVRFVASAGISNNATYGRGTSITGYIDPAYGVVSNANSLMPIMCISSSYAPTGDTTIGAMYGIGYSYSGSTSGAFSGYNNYFGADWGQYTAVNGAVRAFIGTHAWFGGSIYAVSNIVAGGSVTGTSDARLKTNIERIDNAREIVMGIEGVRFDWIDEEKPGRQIGFVAQDVQTKAPELVVEGREHLSLAYGNMTAVHNEALKELYEENLDLKARIERLEKLIEGKY